MLRNNIIKHNGHSRRRVRAPLPAGQTWLQASSSYDSSGMLHSARHSSNDCLSSQHSPRWRLLVPWPHERLHADHTPHCSQPHLAVPVTQWVSFAWPYATSSRNTADSTANVNLTSMDIIADTSKWFRSTDISKYKLFFWLKGTHCRLMKLLMHVFWAICTQMIPCSVTSGHQVTDGQAAQA